MDIQNVSAIDLSWWAAVELTQLYMTNEMIYFQSVNILVSFALLPYH